MWPIQRDGERRRVVVALVSGGSIELEDGQAGELIDALTASLRA